MTRRAWTKEDIDTLSRMYPDHFAKQLTEEEVEEKVKSIIAETGASSMKDMGKVMGLATQRMKGLAEGKTISQIVKNLLSS